MRFGQWSEFSKTFRFRLAIQHMLLVFAALLATFFISRSVVKSFSTRENRKVLTNALQQLQGFYLGELPHQETIQLPEEILQKLGERFPSLCIGHVESESAPNGLVYEIIGSIGSEQLEIFAEPTGRVWVAQRTPLSSVFRDMQLLLQKNTGRKLSLCILSGNGTLLEGLLPEATLFQEIHRNNLSPDTPVVEKRGDTWIGAARLYDGNILFLHDPFDMVAGFSKLWTEFFAVLTIIFLPMSGWIGFHISKRAMAGVQRVSETANRIKVGHLSERVEAGSEGYEIEKLASDFNEMLERIETLMQELRSITTNIAHDLRTPIARIRGMVESLNWEEASPSERKDMAGKVMEQCDQIIPLIDSILEIARADAGMLALEENEFNLAAEVRAAHSLFSGIADDRKINLSCTILDEQVQMVGDRSRMQRVVANLLDNALKFTPEGGRVSIALRQNNNWAILEVSDNGPGIPAEEISRVFERFYRLDCSRSTPGHGLGLSLVNAFVKAFGGTVEIESTSGAGCTVTVVIPLETSSAT